MRLRAGLSPRTQSAGGWGVRWEGFLPVGHAPGVAIACLISGAWVFSLRDPGRFRDIVL